MLTKRLSPAVALAAFLCLLSKRNHFVDAWSTPYGSQLWKTLGRKSSRPDSPRTMLSYRNRAINEDQLTCADTSVHTSSFLHKMEPQNQDRSKGDDGIDHKTIGNVVMGQIGFLAVTLLMVSCIIAPWSLDSAMTLPFHGIVRIGQGTIIESIPLAAVSVFAMIGFEKTIDWVAPRPTSRLQFATTNLVVTLFGRRKRPEVDTQKSTPGHVAFRYTLILSGVTAMTQETIFRLVVPLLIFHWSQSVPLALVGQAALFGIYHVSPATRPEENQALVALQMFNGLIYGGLYFVTGGMLWPCILAHFLYDVHTYTSTWHRVNAQIDWAQDHSEIARSISSSNDAKVLAALQEHSCGALTVDSMQILHRFFFAFDSAHQEYLSLEDVQRAVSYSFWTTETEPSEARVEALFSAILHDRPLENDTHPPLDRLTWVEFVRLLASLRASTRFERQRESKEYSTVSR